MRLALAALAIGLIATPIAAFAHPKIVSASPAANAVATKPATISLTFSEKLLAPMSGMDIVMTGMPGMADHPPMPIKDAKTSFSADGKTMTATLPRPLAAGSYDVNWRIVGADQHRITGKHSFTVK